MVGEDREHVFDSTLPRIVIHDAHTVDAHIKQQRDTAQNAPKVDLFSLVPKVLRLNFDAVMAGLQKPYSERSKDENTLLQLCLKPLKAFHNIHSDLLFEQLYQKFQLLELPKGETIFEQGEHGDAWYIVLFGQVDILISADMSKARRVVVAVTNAGEGFGDMALINQAPRLATAISKTNVILLKVDKNDFAKVSSFTHQIYKKQIIYFMRRFVPIFARLSDSGIRTISEKVVMKNFADKTIILEEGQCVSDVFIIKAGTCKIFRNLVLATKTCKRVFVGTLSQGDHFNNHIILDSRSAAGCAFTVLTDGPVECITLVAAGDWVNLDLNHPPGPFETMTAEDLKKLVICTKAQNMEASIHHPAQQEVQTTDIEDLVLLAQPPMENNSTSYKFYRKGHQLTTKKPPEPDPLFSKGPGTIHLKNLGSETATEASYSESDFKPPDELEKFNQPATAGSKNPTMCTQAIHDLTQKYFSIQRVDVENDASLANHKVGKVSQMLQDRVHENFMKEFWSLHYGIPKSRLARVGNGISKPPPSTRDFDPSPEVIKIRRKRTNLLAHPKPDVAVKLPPVLGAKSEQGAARRKSVKSLSSSVHHHNAEDQSKMIDNLGLAVNLTERLFVGSAGKRALVKLIGLETTEKLYSDQKRVPDTSSLTSEKPKSMGDSSPNERTYKDVEAGLQRDAFNKVQSDLLFNQLFEVFNIVEFPKNHTIFRQGDHGDAWYILLYGRIDIRVANGYDPKNMSLVRILSSGEGFGEMALINSVPRAATVVTRSHVVLIKVWKEDFSRISGFIQEFELRKMFKFLRHYVPWFSHFTDPQIHLVAERALWRYFSPQATIIEERQRLNQIFVIKSGTCDVYRNLENETGVAAQPRRVLVGSLSTGHHFNQQLLRDYVNLAGSPFTVVARGEVECAVLVAVGDWTEIPLDMTPWFHGLTVNDVVKLEAGAKREQKFRKLQVKMLECMAKEVMRDPNAKKIMVIKEEGKEVNWKY
ncbi:hypothetical protein HDU98_006609 [Podochytrium sp. JEL0797]|nr:hypothetical protein HDU98_006609 [Podochytrium sp. JEL0797]